MSENLKKLVFRWVVAHHGYKSSFLVQLMMNMMKLMKTTKMMMMRMILCSLLSSVVVERGRETTNPALQDCPVE